MQTDAKTAKLFCLETFMLYGITVRAVYLQNFHHQLIGHK